MEQSNVIQAVKFKADRHLEKDDMLNLRGTKALEVRLARVSEDVFENKYIEWEEIQGYPDSAYLPVKTWSSATRIILEYMKPEIQDLVDEVGIEMFKEVYEEKMAKVIADSEVKPNINFSTTLFTDDSYITSKVYKSNQNHNIEICRDKDDIPYYVCAVFTCEVARVIMALLDTIKQFRTSRGYRHFLIAVVFINREDIETPEEEKLEEVDLDSLPTIKPKALERDLIGLSLQLQEILLSLYSMSVKNNLDKAEDIIRGIYTEDVPKSIRELGKDYNIQ